MGNRFFIWIGSKQPRYLSLIWGGPSNSSCSSSGRTPPESCSPGGGVSGKYGWLQPTSPNVGSTKSDLLYGVTIASSGDPGQAWAVGWYGSGSESTLTNQLS